MVKLIAWLLLMVICSGFWGMVIYFSADILFETSLPALKAFGLGTAFYVFLVGFRTVLKICFDDELVK